jgi:hypothetical protein
MITITSLLLPPQNELAASIKETLDKEGVAVTAGGGPSVSLAALRLMSGALAEKLTKLVDEIGFADILVGAWNKAFAVRQQLEKSAKSPDKELFLQLAEHKISSEHKPYVALMKDGQELGRVPFTISIEFTLQGAVLRLLGGAIKEIQAGRIVKGKGTVKCGRLLLVEKEFQPLQIPGVIPAPPAKTVATVLHVTARHAS